MGYEQIPRQKLPIKKKGDKWRRSCVDAYIDLSNQGTGYTSSREDLRRYYDYYNGIIDEGDYRYVLQPYGKTRKNFPSQMRNYPIIKPIIDLLLGEKSKRPLNYTVTVQNSDTVTLKEQAKNDMLMENFKKQFANELGERGINTGMDPMDIEVPEHILQLFENSYVDNRAIMGQKGLNYIMYNENIREKFNKAWFHFLISGQTYTHRGVRNGETFYEVLNPVDVDYDLDPDLDYVEDGDWALTRKWVHTSTVIDNYYDYLTEDQVLELEDPKHSETDNYFLYASAASKDPNSYRNRLVEVISVYWKSRKRIGFMAYLDPSTGAIEEKEVEDGYRMPAELKETGAKIEWLWVNEVWEGTRIDGRFYINMRPIPNQRQSIDDASTCKLPINGRRYSNINTSNVSLVQLGIPYQLNYNIYKYRLELAIARSKDIVAQFDINMIPKKWDMDKFMYYVEGTGIAWVDYNKEGIQLSPQHQSVLDMSIKTIEQYITLLGSILEEWEKLSGVTRQRQGEIGQYEGKSSSQQAIVQSSHITEDLFKKFEGMERRDMQALLDYSKEAWHAGKKGMYVMPDGTQEFLDIDSVNYMESNFGIFVSNSGKDQEKLDLIKGMSQAMIQNGLPASAALEIFESDSFPIIKSKIKKAETAQQQLEQAQQQAQQQQVAAQLKADQEKLQLELNEKQKDRDNAIKIALIQSEGAEAAQTVSENKNVRDFTTKLKDLDIKTLAQQEVERSNKADENIKRDELKLKAQGDRLKARTENKKIQAIKSKPKTS
jgi:hypothetical protein